ncbi:MAG TPA: FUN14 domain-containing protein [Phycisphaerae bacterium]|nr:FUN14 domain-containing protein [Phycisphaerae bacterium]
MGRPEQPPESPHEQEQAAPRRLAAWKKLLLALSCVLMVAGLGLQGFGYLRGPAKTQPKPAGGGRAPLGVKGFAPTGTPGGAPSETLDTATAEESIEDWYPAIFRLGFSFFVGFCIAYALRVFLKVSLLAIGVILLALFGLQYAGVVQVNWSAMETHYQSVASWLTGQFASFRDFVTGYLPSASSGVMGMLVGFKKH